jgi:hypothetical protein
MTTIATGDSRILLLAAEQAMLFIVKGRRLVHAYQFEANELGIAGFADYLRQAPPLRTMILLDVVEEEYRPDSVPHIGRKDRSAVLARKFARQFRGTPYCIALNQGRETEGRRDDRVLLTALIKPEILTPWLDELARYKTPLIGIYSMPILTQQLLPKLNPTSANVLIISVQQVSGLRQTFFRDGHLKISRLAPMPRVGAGAYANYLLAELGKLRRYLNSLALAARDNPLAIYIVSHGELLKELEKHCQNSDTEQYYLLDTAELVTQLGLAVSDASPYSDAIFAQLLLDAPPRSSYAQPIETRYYQLLRTKWALVASSFIMLLGSAGWSALRFIDAVNLKHQALDAQNKAAFYQERFELAHQGLPPTVVDAPAIQIAVDAVRTLEQQRSTPSPLLKIIGTQLAALPGLVVDKIEWYAATDPNQQAPHRTTHEASTIEVSPKYSHYNIGVLYAHVAEFDGDYRTAIAKIDQLVISLKTSKDVHAVEVARYPLDVRPVASLAGNASGDKTPPAAEFALKIVLGVASDRHQG